MRALRRVSLVGLLLAGAALGASPASGEAEVQLELLHPAGPSPKVFTEGWVFGARCVLRAGGAEVQDVSEQVQWSGTGTFEPARGPTSRPRFQAAGANTIVLSVTVAGETATRRFEVFAVDPRPSGGAARTYARVGDLAACPACVHGCPACPHAVQGPVLTGSPNVTIGGVPAARVGDTGTHAQCCGPNTFEIVEGDADVLIDGKPAARLGDATKHCGGQGKLVAQGQAYYVAFAPTKVEVKPNLMPKREKDESAEAWSARRKAAIARLTWRDFEFVEPGPEARPFVLKVTGAALARHPFPFGHPDAKAGTRYVLPLRGSLKNEKTGEGIPLAGALLLTLEGSHADVKALQASHPDLDADDIQRIPSLNAADGTGVYDHEDQRIHLGPLERETSKEGEWSDAAKERAAALLLAILPYFDCFVADAVYGDPAARAPDVFRDFRARVLLRTEAGRRLVRLYEDYGPEYAMRLRSAPALRPWLRAALDLLAARLERLDLEDPVTLARLDALVAVVEPLASAALRSHPRPPLGRLARLFGGRPAASR